MTDYKIPTRYVDDDFKATYTTLQKCKKMKSKSLEKAHIDQQMQMACIAQRANLAIVERLDKIVELLENK